MSIRSTWFLRLRLQRLGSNILQNYLQNQLLKFLRLRLQRLGSNKNILNQLTLMIRFCDFVYKDLVQTFTLSSTSNYNWVSATSFTKTWFKPNDHKKTHLLTVSATSFTKTWFKHHVKSFNRTSISFCDFVYKDLVQTKWKSANSKIRWFLRLRLQRLGSNNLLIVISFISFSFCDFVYKDLVQTGLHSSFRFTFGFCDFVYKDLVQT